VISFVRITAAGQDFLANAAHYLDDRSLGGLAQAVMTYNTTFNGPVGQSVVGGTGHTQHAAHISLPEDEYTRQILEAVAAMHAAIGADNSVDSYTKEDAAQALVTLEGEIRKPAAEQEWTSVQLQALRCGYQRLQLPERSRPKQPYLRYCSSLTFFIQSTTLPSSCS
jgi:hypothetical protein